MNYCLNRIIALRKEYDEYKELREQSGQSWEQFLKIHKRNEIDRMKEAKELYEEACNEGIFVNSDKSSEKWFMISIRPNPKENLHVEDFHNDIQSLIKGLKYELLHYVFEQKGDSMTTIGHGLHSHILFKVAACKNYYRSHILKYIKRKSHNIYKYTNANCVQLDDIFYPEKALKYISGEKSEEKMGAVKYDPIFRKQNGLEAIYTLHKNI